MRIFQHLFDEGWLQEGDLVADPFGGIGVTALAAASFGCPCILVELEEKFCKLAEENFELHKKQWEKMGKPRPVCVQGDSRNFSSIIREAVDSIITSPPYSESAVIGPVGQKDIEKQGDILKKQGIEAGYGSAEGQIGAMKEGKLDEVVAVITSPPYSEIRFDGGDAYKPDYRGSGTKHRGEAYGECEGQLGGMPEGDHTEVVDSIITSPPYSHSMSSEKSGIDWSKCKREDGRPRDMTREPAHATRIGAGGEMRYSPSPDNVGNLPEGNHAEVVDSIVTSPPYPEVISTGERRDIQKAIEAENRYLEAHPELKGKRPKLHLYGDSEGQIGHLHEGDHAGAVDSIVTSPPYADSMTRGGHLVWREQGRVGAHKDSKGKSEIYSADPANMGNLPEGSHEAVVDAVVTSPPYENAISAHGEGPQALGERHGRESHPDEHAAKAVGQGYGITPANIGNEQGATYWGAVKDVYCECLKSLKPGGVMAVVVKAFVRNKKIVDLPSQTLELLEAIGFEPLERIRAWMTSPVTQKSLLPDMVGDYTKKRASFFRRLYERKYPENKIDFEEVLVVRKPIPDCH